MTQDKPTTTDRIEKTINRLVSEHLHCDQTLLRLELERLVLLVERRQLVKNCNRFLHNLKLFKPNDNSNSQCNL